MGMGEELMIEEMIQDMVWKDAMKKVLQDHVWVTRDGEALQIKDMSSSHIRNCIKLLEKNIEESKTGVRGVMRRYLNLFHKELSRRYPPIDPAEL